MINEVYQSQHIGKRIKYIRKLNNMTQIPFAESIGIAQGILSEIESGKSMPTLEAILSISNVYNIDINWLINEKSEDSLNVNEKEVDLILKYRQLEKNAQEEVQEYIELKLKRYRKD